MSEIRIDITAEDAEADAALQRVEDKQTKLSASTSRLASEYDGLTASSSSSIKAIDRNSESFQKLDDELTHLLSTIDPVYKAQRNLDTGNDLLHQGFQKGLLDQNQYQDALKKLAGTYNEAEVASGHAATGSSRVTRELMVLGHEAVSGNFSRMPGSFMVLASALGSVLGPISLVAGAVAAGAYAWHEYGASTKEAGDSLDEFGIASAKIIHDLDDQIVKLRERNILARQGITGQDASTADALVTLQRKIAAERDVLANSVPGTYNATSATIELTKAVNEYNELVNRVADKSALESEYKKIEKAAKDAAKAHKEHGNAYLAEQDAARAWEKALEDAGKIQDQAEGKTNDMTKGQMALKAYLESAAYSINEKTNPAMNQMAVQAYMNAIAMEQLAAATDAEAKARDKSNKEHEKALEMASREYNRVVEAAMSPQEREQSQYKQELQDAEKFRKANLISEQQYHTMIEAAQKKHLSNLWSSETAFGKMMLAFKSGNHQQEVTSTLGFMTELSAMGASHHRAMFEINKVASIANAVVNTYQAASSALKDVPYPWNLAAAAAITVQGMLQVDNINSTSFGGGSASAGGGGVPSMANSPGIPVAPMAQASVAPPPAASAPTPEPQHIYLNIKGGSVFTAQNVRDDLAPLLQDAIRDRVINVVIS